MKNKVWLDMRCKAAGGAIISSHVNSYDFNGRVDQAELRPATTLHIAVSMSRGREDLSVGSMEGCFIVAVTGCCKGVAGQASCTP